jgi:hypothetical protein
MQKQFLYCLEFNKKDEGIIKTYKPHETKFPKCINTIRTTNQQTDNNIFQIKEITQSRNNRCTH